MCCSLMVKGLSYSCKCSEHFNRNVARPQGIALNQELDICPYTSIANNFVLMPSESAANVRFEIGDVFPKSSGASRLSPPELVQTNM